MSSYESQWPAGKVGEKAGEVGENLKLVQSRGFSYFQASSTICLKAGCDQSGQGRTNGGVLSLIWGQFGKGLDA